MTKQIQLRRGTTAEHELFTGAVGEVTIDTSKDIVIVHDGVTVGGHELVGVAATGQTIVNKDGIAIGSSTLVPGYPLTVQGNTYVSGNAKISESLESKSILVNNLNAVGYGITTFNLNTSTRGNISSGSTVITLTNITDISVGDFLTIPNYLASVLITGIGTGTSDVPFNQTILSTTVSKQVGIGITVIPLNSISSISVGNIITVFNNLGESQIVNAPIVGFTTVVLDPTNSQVTSTSISSTTGSSDTLIAVASTENVSIGNSFSVASFGVQNIPITGLTTVTVNPYEQFILNTSTSQEVGIGTTIIPVQPFSTLGITTGNLTSITVDENEISDVVVGLTTNTIIVSTATTVVIPQDTTITIAEIRTNSPAIQLSSPVGAVIPTGTNVSITELVFSSGNAVLIGSGNTISEVISIGSTVSISTITTTSPAVIISVATTSATTPNNANAQILRFQPPNSNLDVRSIETQFLNSIGITTISGLTYPTLDGNKGQVLATDGAGNIGFTTGGGGGGSNVILRVSSKTGSDDNDGKILPLATIKKATQLASLVGEPTTILVETGEYLEDNPIIVYDEVSIIGDSLRNIVVRPLNAGKDLIKVRNGCYITGMTFNDYVNPVTGIPQHTYNYSIAFDDPYDPTISRSGYAATAIVNVTNALYTPSAGILTVTTSTPHQLYKTNSVRLSGLAFTCGYDEVGVSTFRYTNTTGVSTCTTVNVHGLSTGSKVFLAGLAFTCSAEHAGVTTTIFPDGTSQYGRIFTVTSVGSTNTFTFNAGISTIGHDYVSGGTVQKALIYPEANSDGRIDFGVISVGSSTTFTIRVGVTTVPHYYTQDGTARISKPIINKSPYVQNCSILSFLGGSGILVDGNKIVSQNEPIIAELGERPVAGEQPEFGKSMVAATFTMVSFGGVGWRTINDGYAQVVSCFQIFCRYASLTQSGGYLSITNSATNFGDFSLRSTGFSPNSFIFDRGRVAATGTKDGLQTLKVIGVGRTEQDLYVLQLFDGNLVNRTGLFKPVVSTQEFNGGQISTSTNIFTIAGHPFSNLDPVVYLGNENDANPQVIGGMIPGNQYYVSYIDASNFTLYQDEGLETIVTIGSTFVGINTLTKNNQEFYVNEIFDTHNSYQVVSLASTSSTLKFVSGRQVTQTVTGGNAVGFALTFNSSTRQLIVSVESSGGTRRFFSTSGADISDHNIVPVSIGVTAVAGITTYKTVEFKVDSTNAGTVIAGINTLPENYYLHFHRPSIINSSGHTWEYSGSGTDYNALPQNGGKGDVTTEQISELGGRVYASGTNELGDFKIGNQITAFNRTGSIIFNNKVSIGELDSIRLSLSGGVAVEEFSTDVNLGEGELGGPQNRRVSTQLAVRSFLGNRLGTFIDKTVSTNAVPNAVVQLNSNGQINADLIPPKVVNFNITNVGGGRTVLANEIPAINILQGDTVVEPDDSYILVNDVLSQYLIIDNNTTVYNFNNGDVVTSALAEAVTGVVTTPPRGISVALGTTGYVDYNYVGYGTTGFVKGVLLGGTITNAGSGYNVAGVYTGVQLTTISGVGTESRANITIGAGGSVTNVDISAGGRYYASGNIVSAAATYLGGRTGGADLQFTINDVETRLYVKLTNNQKFAGSTALADYLADGNAVSISTSLTGRYEVSITPADISIGGDIDFTNDRIVVGAGNSFINGDPVIYDANGGNIITVGGLGIVNLSTYYTKVVGAGTSIELHRTYQLNDLLDLTGSGTGTHKLARVVVNIEKDAIVLVGHGYSTGTPVRVTGSTPVGIDTHAFYYVGSVTTNSFTFHLTQNDALSSVNGVGFNVVSIASTSTGTMTLTKQNVRYTSVVNTSSTNVDNWSLLARDSIDASNIVSGVISPTRLGTGSANSDTVLTGTSEYRKAVFSVGIGTTQPLGVTSYTSADLAPDGVGVNTYYGKVNLNVTRAAGTINTYSTLGVARFKTSTFSVDGDGNVSIKNSLTGDVDASTLGGQTGVYYLDSANHSGSVPITRGGTGLTGVPAIGAILIGNGSAYNLTTTPTFTGVVNFSGGTSSTTSTNGQVIITGGLGVSGNVSIGLTMTATTVVESSDARIKENIKTIENALDKTSKLRGVEYDLKFNGQRKIGLIAQEVETIIPEVVFETSDSMKGVAYGNIIGLLVESIKELKSEIDNLKKSINTDKN